MSIVRRESREQGGGRNRGAATKDSIVRSLHMKPQYPTSRNGGEKGLRKDWIS